MNFITQSTLWHRVLLICDPAAFVLFLTNTWTKANQQGSTVGVNMTIILITAELSANVLFLLVNINMYTKQMVPWRGGLTDYL